MNPIKIILEWRKKGIKEFNNLPQREKEYVQFLASWVQILLILMSICILIGVSTNQFSITLIGAGFLVIQYLFALEIKRAMRKRNVR